MLICVCVCVFRATSVAYGSSQARGQIGATAASLHPQPQQRQIWATSATYTTAHSNAKSLTHWVRPGIEPMDISQIRFCQATVGTPEPIFLSTKVGKLPVLTVLSKVYLHRAFISSP